MAKYRRIARVLLPPAVGFYSAVDQLCVKDGSCADAGGIGLDYTRRRRDDRTDLFNHEVGRTEACSKPWDTHSRQARWLISLHWRVRVVTL